MAHYKVDQQDVYFNLFDYLKVQEQSNAFQLGDLRDILEEYYKFSLNEIWPTRSKSDQQGVKLTDQGVIVPPCLRQMQQIFYQNDWFRLGYPEEAGGIPVPHSIRIAADSYSNGANVAWMAYPGIARAALNVILKIGEPEQKQIYLEKMMSGQWGGTMCLTEPNAGSDVGNLTTSAKPIAKGNYSIKGVKMFITNGDNDLYENNIHLVLARIQGAEPGTKGLSLFIVPKIKINSDGTLGEFNDIKCNKVEEKMGLHASATCELSFGANGNCEGQLIGRESQGMESMFLMMNEARLLCGLQGEAQGNLCYELSLQYAKERTQFGKAIIEFPDIKRILLKMRALGRGMRAMILYIADLFDQHNISGKQEIMSEIELLTPICKSFLGHEASEMAIDAIQIHGGYGYCKEYGIEQFLRDTKVITLYEGTSGIQAIDYVSRKLLRDQGKTFTALKEKIHQSLAHPLGKEFSQEKQLLATSLKQATEVVELFVHRAKARKNDLILQHATDFLFHSSHIVTGYLLYEHALLACKNLSSTTNEEKKQFLESKIIDMKIFFQHYLTKNTGIFQKIMHYEQDLSAIEL